MPEKRDISIISILTIQSRSQHPHVMYFLLEGEALSTPPLLSRRMGRGTWIWKLSEAYPQSLSILDRLWHWEQTSSEGELKCGDVATELEGSSVDDFSKVAKGKLKTQRRKRQAIASSQGALACCCAESLPA